MAARWLMAAVLLAASWASGGVLPARVVLGVPWAASTGPIAPTEEHENHSSTPLVLEARGNAKHRERAADLDHQRQKPPVLRQIALLPIAPGPPPGASFEGHRLANGLMAPMQT